MLRMLSLALAAAVLAGAGALRAATPNDDAAVPRYDHIFVIVEENKDYEQILDPAAAPNIAGLRCCGPSRTRSASNSTCATRPTPTLAWWP